MTTMMTTLGGTLRRVDHNQWVWSDGTPAEGVEDLRVQDCAPNFRCTIYGDSTWVDIPYGWRSARLWPNGVVDDDAAQVIARLIESHGRTQRTKSGQRTKPGWQIPIKAWNAEMLAPFGATWRRSYEEAIITTAKRLGWNGRWTRIELLLE